MAKHGNWHFAVSNIFAVSESAVSTATIHTKIELIIYLQDSEKGSWKLLCLTAGPQIFLQSR